MLELRGITVHPAQLSAIAAGLDGCRTLVEAADEAEVVLVPPRLRGAIDPVAAIVIEQFRTLRAGWPDPFLSPDDADTLIGELKAALAGSGLSGRDILHGLRVTLTGRDRGIALRYVVAGIERSDALSREAA